MKKQLKCYIYTRVSTAMQVNAAVEEVICKLVKNPKSEEQIRKKIGVSLDMQYAGNG